MPRWLCSPLVNPEIAPEKLVSGFLYASAASSSAAAASAAGSSAAAPEAAFPGPRPSTLADLLEGKLGLAIAEQHPALDKAPRVEKLALMSAAGGGTSEIGKGRSRASRKSWRIPKMSVSCKRELNVK